jgi:hypothetical protein
MKTRFFLPLFVAVLVGVAGWSAHAQGQKMSSPRPTWDYKIVAFTAGDPPRGFRPELYEDGKPIPTSETSALPKLKELGNDGWELVTALQSLNENNHWFFRYYLKRAK